MDSNIPTINWNPSWGGSIVTTSQPHMVIGYSNSTNQVFRPDLQGRQWYDHDWPDLVLEQGWTVEIEDGDWI